MLLIVDSEVNHFIFDLECDIECLRGLMEDGYLEGIGPELIETMNGMIAKIKEAYADCAIGGDFEGERAQNRFNLQ